MPTLFYHTDQSVQDKGFLKKAMEDFGNFLSTPPLKVQCQIESLPEDMVQPIYKEINAFEDIRVWSTVIAGVLRKQYGRYCKLIMACSPQSRFAQSARKCLPHALWGFYLLNLALVYNYRNPYAIWHEAFHLLGTEDCYDLTKNDRGPNCEHPNCIMQYEATIESVRAWPFLCSKNVQKIQDCIRQWK